MPFPAKYNGYCQAGDVIKPGDEVEYRGERGEEQLFHVACEKQPEEKPHKFQGTSIEDMGY